MPRRLFALNLVATALHLNACSLVVDFKHIEPTAASNAGTGNAGTGNAGTGNAGTGNAGTGNAGTGNGIALSTGGGLPVETAGAQSMPWAPAIAAGQAGLASANAPPGTAGMGGLNNRTSTSAAGPGGSTSLAGSSSIEPTSKGATAGTGGSNAGGAPNTGRAGALGVSDPTSHGGVGGRLTNSAGSVSHQQAGRTSLAGDAGASGSPANGGAPPTAGTKGKAAAVCVGESHNCALVDGSAYCWGNDNTYGQLGDRSSNFLIPSKIGVGPVAATVSAISCSHKHTCVVADGEAYCWGSNSDGQLAMMGGGSSATPVRIMLDGTVTSIAAGQDHSCAVANGKAFCWGYNGQGQLGDGTSTERSIPVQLTQMAIGTTAIYAGDTQSCAIKDGRAYCWGYNNWGTTGNGAPLGGSDVYTPTAVVNLSDRIQAMSAGHEHTCAIGNGVLYCWGCNVKAELGTGSTGGDTSIPLEAAILRNRGAVTAVAAGGNTTCAVADNRLYCWGQSDSGQLGTIDPSTDFSAAATEIPFEANGTITAIAVRNRACAVVDGNVYCWGSDFGYGNRPLRVSFPG